jgi:aquaporin Z
MLNTMRRHWPEYLMEAAGLGLFMISAAMFATLLEHPSSPIHQALPDPFLRRALMGLAMGSTAVSIIYSPWGQQSGAHINPAVTVTFLRLGKIAPADAAGYIVAQFIGGVAGILIAAALIGMYLADPSISYVATTPGRFGVTVAFIAEVAISFGLMLVVLIVSNHQSRPPTPGAPGRAPSRVARFTGVFAGCLVALYITIESPLSGMSMNPARTFGSAFPGHVWTALWVYFTAPLLGMLLAAECYARLNGAKGVICAKLNHHNNKRCIFRCGYMTSASSS